MRQPDYGDQRREILQWRRQITTALAAASVAHANLVVNGSFELGAFFNQGNGTMSLAAGSNVITGWTVVTDTTGWIGTPNPWGLSASDGNFFLDLTNYQAGAPFAGMSQTIATTVGATYSLTFDLRSSSAWGPPGLITASAAGTSQNFVSSATGVDIWTSYSMPFVASSTTTTILLQGASGLNYIGLDNVDVEFVSGPGTGPGPGPVPEPGTLALLGVGLVGLVATRRPRFPRR